MEKTERTEFEPPEIVTYDRQELELPKLAFTFAESGLVGSGDGSGAAP